MDFAEHVKSSVDIVRVIGEYLPLKRVGAGPRYVGRCPFHEEKTPSFSVHGGHQFFKCFGCGKGGDVYTFVMEIEGITFYEALTQLAEKHGIPRPQRSEQASAEAARRTALLAMHETAAKLFHSQLAGPAGQAARAYLDKRGVASSMIEDFQLGYSDKGGSTLTRRLQQEGYGPDLLEASGLVLKRADGSFFDRFRGRLMFPIHNESGKVIAFGGRAMEPEDEPKYLNSSETAIYRKSGVLYSLHRAKESMRREDRAVLVEGYMDVIGVYSAGVHNVVATCGTALTVAQVQAIRRHTSRLVINYDPDNAGANATEKGINLLLSEGMHVRVAQLTGGLDPDEYIGQHGAEAYQARLNDAASYFHWLADRARARHDMTSAEGRLEAFRSLLPVIKEVHDQVERAAIAHEMAEYLRVERGVISEEFRKLGGGRKPARAAAAPPSALSQLRSFEVDLLHALLFDEQSREAVLSEVLQSPALVELRVGRIVRQIGDLVAAGRAPSLAELETTADEADKALLAALVFAEGKREEVEPAALAERSVHALRALAAELQSKEISRQIQAAEKAGNLAEAMRLMEEYHLLKRQQGKRGGVASG